MKVVERRPCGGMSLAAAASLATPPPRFPELERFAKGGSDKLFSLIRLKEFPLGANGVYLSQLSRPGQEAVNPGGVGGFGRRGATSPAAGDERSRAAASRHKRRARGRQPPSPIKQLRLLTRRDSGATQG